MSSEHLPGAEEAEVAGFITKTFDILSVRM